MSLNSSKSTAPRSFKPANLFQVVGLLAWVLLSFFAAQFVVVLGAGLLSGALGFEISLDSAATQFTLTALIYMLTLVFVLGGSILIKQTVSRRELGVSKAINWLDLGLAPAAFIAYMIISTGAVLLLSQLVPGFEVDQAQQVGFDNLVGRFDLLMAFIALVIIAPIAEEVLFRGYLYGKLRSHASVLAATLLTSALFGAVHMQWNVAIDTFILSLAMCYLRELTGTIWAGTLVHMIKNGLAFTLIFIVQIV